MIPQGPESREAKSRDVRTSRARVTLLSTVLLAIALGCNSPTGLRYEVALARARWAQRGPASYSVTVARWCECLESGPVVVTVRNGVVESRHYTRDGAPVPPAYADLFPSVEGLFEVVEAAQRGGAAGLDVSYDPRLGYPVRIAIDWHAVHVDDEVTYEAKDLVVR